MDGGPDEGRCLQDRPERPGGDDLSDWPGRVGRVFSDGVAWVGNSDVGTVVGDRGAHRCSPDVPVRASRPGGRGRLRRPGRHAGPGANPRGGDRRARGEGREVLHSGSANSQILDPAILASELGFWVESATCAKLLNYPDAPAPEGWNLQPEVAASMPEVSPDGRTYKFTVRSGLPILSAVERTGDRGDLPLLDRTGPRLRALGGNAPAIPPRRHRGRGAFLAGRGRPHLRPSGRRRHPHDRTDGARRPTSWNASPSRSSVRSRPTHHWCRVVRAHTPAIRIGAPLAVPSAGPYYIADHLDGEYTILKRNPNYTGPRPHAFDAIALREGIDPGVAVGQVESGRGTGSPTSSIRSSPRRSRSPRSTEPGTASGEGILLRRDAPPLTGFNAFNASRPPFSDPAVRRAAALALDREAIAAIWGNVPTDQFLPPVMPGFEDRGAVRTRRIGHRGGTHADAWQDASPPSWPSRRETIAIRQEAEVVRSNLASIGITVEIEESPRPHSPLHQDQDAEIDLIGAGLRGSTTRTRRPS